MWKECCTEGWYTWGMVRREDGAWGIAWQGMLHDGTWVGWCLGDCERRWMVTGGMLHRWDGANILVMQIYFTSNLIKIQPLFSSIKYLNLGSVVSLGSP